MVLGVAAVQTGRLTHRTSPLERHDCSSLIKRSSRRQVMRVSLRNVCPFVGILDLSSMLAINFAIMSSTFESLPDSS